MHIPQKAASFVTLALLIALAISGPAASAHGAALITTDKASYSYGEAVKVYYSGAPGADRDWVCIVPAGSPDTEGGDFQYLPPGARQGVLTFAAPPPGKYEARAYYNYEARGYAVAGRHAFAVGSNPEYEKAQLQLLEQLERKADAGEPLEAGLRAGEGLVYICREPAYSPDLVDAEIKAGGQVIATLPDSRYLALPVAAGEVRFATGRLTTWDVRQNKKEEAWTMQSGEATINVKAGHVYYLKLSIVFRGGYAPALELVPYREGAALITASKLTLHK